MFFRRMREKMKIVIAIVVIAMAGGLVWAGVAGLLDGQEASYPTEAATAVATVNGQGISLYALQQTFINRLQQIEQEHGVLPGRSHEAVRFQALDALVGNLIVSQEIANR